MSKQSKLEKVGIERRNEHELVRNDIQKNKPYSAEHPYAKSTEGQPLGKGTTNGGGPTHVNPRLDIENGGGEYDINGFPGRDGGRKWLQAISLYNKENQYGPNSVDTTANIEDGHPYGQIYIK